MKNELLSILTNHIQDDNLANTIADEIIVLLTEKAKLPTDKEVSMAQIFGGLNLKESAIFERGVNWSRDKILGK